VTSQAPQDPLSALAVGLAELRGEFGTGIAEIKGSLGLLVQQATYTDKRITDHDTALASLDRRTAELEHARAADEEVLQANRRRMQTVSALAGVAAVVAAVVPLIH
jgi:multidrug efflux pump subunit AcrA (membrane-fusion protein)